MNQLQDAPLVFLLLATALAVAKPPPSPCPEVFEYENDVEKDRWYGVVSFRSNIELVGLHLKIKLDKPAHLLVSWDGEVRTEDNTSFRVFNPFSIYRARDSVRARVMVKFNPANGIPTVRTIVINGNTLCPLTGGGASSSSSSLSGQGSAVDLDGRPVSTSSTERYDPVFNSNVGDIADEFISKGGNDNVEDDPRESVFIRPPSEETYHGGNVPASRDRDTSVAAVNRERPQLHDSQNRNSLPPSEHSSSGGKPLSASSSAASDSGWQQNTRQQSPSTETQWTTVTGSSNRPSSQDRPTHSQPEGSNWQPPQSKPTISHTPLSSFSVDNSWNTGNGNVDTTNSQRQQPPNRGGQNYDNNQYSGGPIVTTLTIPNSGSNSNRNIDEIVQIIKTQLEQQKGSGGIAGNGTTSYIVAVLNPAGLQLQQNTQAPTSSSSSNMILTSSSPSSYLSTTRPSPPPQQMSSKANASARPPVTQQNRNKSSIGLGQINN